MAAPLVAGEMASVAIGLILDSGYDLAHEF